MRIPERSQKRSKDVAESNKRITTEKEISSYDFLFLYDFSYEKEYEKTDFKQKQDNTIGKIHRIRKRNETRKIVRNHRIGERIRNSHDVANRVFFFLDRFFYACF